MFGLMSQLNALGPSVHGWRRPHARPAPHPRRCARAATSYGPEPPPQASRRKPEWVRILEEDAGVDEDVRDLLDGTGGDPDRIREKMQQRLRSPPNIGTSERRGSDTPPVIAFREVDYFDLWLWMEFEDSPGEEQRELLSDALRAWFAVGKLGGYNTQNMQVYYSSAEDTSQLDYNSEQVESSMTSYLHALGVPEFRGNWARVNIDLGTADELALDVLLNMLVGFSADCAALKRIYVGGENETWRAPDEEALGGSGSSSSSRRREEVPKVGIDPMRTPQGVDDDLELLQMLQEEQEEQEARGAAAGAAQRPSFGPMGAQLPPGFDPGSLSLYSEQEFKRKFPERRGGDG